jgi:predicted ATP-dependent serine protease
LPAKSAQPWAPGAGTVFAPLQAGSRVLLAEIQALTATGFLGAAKRRASGLDAARLAMLIAVRWGVVGREATTTETEAPNA